MSLTPMSTKIQCVKCSSFLPVKYYFGGAKDDKWAECIHTGWYCPNHSPTNNCDDNACGLCNNNHDNDYDNDDNNDDLLNAILKTCKPMIQFL